MSKGKSLKKELNLFDVYAIATGTTLSGGFFLLPGLAAQEAGPAIFLSYMIAAIPLIPAMLCKIELATAMPRSGGTYYFVDRSLGPLAGTIAGLGTWLALVLKSSFALVGVGAYLSLYIHGNYMMPLAIGFALFFGVLNLIGTKETGSIQVMLVAGILVLLGGFIGNGFFNLNMARFDGVLDVGMDSMLGTAGFVYVSYMGITKIASVSEEVKDPERNLPLGVFLSFATAIVVYGLGTYVMVGVIPIEELKGNLTPVATAAECIAGPWGKILVTIAAVFAFSSVINAGILSASRYPLAMSRDHLISKVFRDLTKHGIPRNSILVTLGVMISALILFDPAKLAKLASVLLLLVLALCCLAVIIMRESHIEAYDPGYRSPWYPWMPIFGIVSHVFLIIEMGLLPSLFSAGLIAVGTIWYYYYARNRVERGGAILHVFERLGQYRHVGLEPELRGILKEKGLRDHDPFDELVTQAQVIDLDKIENFETIITRASKLLAERVSYPAEKIEQEILDGTKVGATPVSHGVALPHMRLHHIVEPVMLIVRAQKGLNVVSDKEFWGEHVPTGSVYAIFFLISPEEDPKQHLRILAKLAGRVDNTNFIDEWKKANNEQDIKEILLRDERFISVSLRKGSKAGKLAGMTLMQIDMPEETLIALIQRDGKTIVPRGNRILKEGDRLTVIGDSKGIKEFRNLYGS